MNEKIEDDLSKMVSEHIDDRFRVQPLGADSAGNSFLDGAVSIYESKSSNNQIAGIILSVDSYESILYFIPMDRLGLDRRYRFDIRDPDFPDNMLKFLKDNINDWSI